VQEGGLAAAAWPYDPDPGVARYLEVDPPQGDDLAEPLADTPELDTNAIARRRVLGRVSIAGQLGWHPTDPSGC
jgi:hypothetical protein